MSFATGARRSKIPIFPWAAYAIGVFGVINIIYAAFVCLAQTDLKKLIAHSSVSHMGFLVSAWRTPLACGALSFPVAEPRAKASDK